MRWADEQFVKVYTRDTVDWLALSYDARSLFLNLLRKVDRAGILPLGRHGRRGVAVLLGATDMWESRLSPALAELEQDGCLRVEGDSLIIPNFTVAQEARQTDRARKQAQRERDRSDAMGCSVTARDAIAQMERSVSHDVTPDVTRGHTASREVTLRRDETRREETRVTASQSGETPSAPTGQQPLVFVQPTPPAEQPKKPSTAVAQWAEEADALRLPLIPADAPRKSELKRHQWPKLGEAFKAHGALTLTAAFRIFLADEYARSQAFPLGLFVSQVDTWVTKAQAVAARVRVSGGDAPRLGPKPTGPTPPPAGDRPRL